MNKYDALKIENQICFPLYACSREIIKQYKPFLDEIDLTYTQYIAMMVLWEHKTMNVKAMGQILYLDSGTLTPLLKKLESKGLVTRQRSAADERNLVVTITDAGEALKGKAVTVPAEIAKCSKLEPEEAAMLYKILYKMLGREE
ncbi:MAG: MarR family transcriptional regulator [Oscillospiraceae bacterium]|nr:MarR family transcriptional regulator [Oscillospiraceae bacterium]